MNEGKKTGIFCSVAAVMLAVGSYVAWPTAPSEGDGGFPIGQSLFQKFVDPSATASLRIVSFDEDRGQLDTFEVVRDAESGLWTIPSRDHYPADATEHMREAANALIGLKMLDVQTSKAEDHDDLGVAEPSVQDTQVGDEGVGRMVTFKDDTSETLASLIIGDRVKNEPEKRYVRIPGQDPVYVVKLDVAPLTTRFQAWIERDLLQLSSIDISKIQIKDYTTTSVDEKMALSINYAAALEINHQDWQLAKLLEYDPKNPTAGPTEVTIGPEKKLNQPKLDQIKNALDDLQIVNVVHKPDAMSANLRDNRDLLSDPAAMGSLRMHGFYPGQAQGSEVIEIFAANGDMTVTLNNGVQYVMRFGNISGVGSKSDADVDKDSNVETGVNRYFLVTTMVDESQFPVPDLTSVPQTLEELDAVLNPKKEDQETEEKKEEDQPKDDDDSEVSEQERMELLEAEQEKITKANQRKMDARKDAMEVAERRVRLLNERFADWYYVIPEDTYTKLRVARDELFED